MLPQFLHCKDPEQPATDYILHTHPPFIVGQIVQFTDESTVIDFIARKQAENGYFLGAQVEGYNILVIFAGSLSDSTIINNYAAFTIVAFFKRMAAEYLQNRIKQREQRFRRYKK